MVRTPPRRAFRLATVLAVTTGLLVSGCGQVKAGSAALVGDQRVTMDELSQTVATVERAAGEGGLQVRDRALLVRAVLGRMITGMILEEAAERKGISVSRGGVDRRIAHLGGRQQAEARALRGAVPPGQLRDYIRRQIIQQRLAKSLAGGGDTTAQASALVAYLQQVARDLGVTVSPRYGTFSVRRLTVMPEASDLSTPDPDSGIGAGLGGPGPAGSGSPN